MSKHFKYIFKKLKKKGHYQVLVPYLKNSIFEKKRRKEKRGIPIIHHSMLMLIQISSLTFQWLAFGIQSLWQPCGYFHLQSNK